MPIRRRNRFLAGIGDAAGGVGDVLMREGLRRRQLDDQRKYDLQLKASQETDPAQMERLINIGKKFNLDLTPFRQSPEALLKPSFASIGSASDENNLSVNALLKQVEGFNRPDVLVRAIQTLPQAVAERGGQIQRGDVAKVEQAGALKRAESYASTSGTNAANAENFPTVLGQKKQEGEQTNALDTAHQRELNPVLASRAGAEAGARVGAETTDAAIAAAAKKAGAIKEAESNFTPATDSERQAASFYVRSVRGHNAALQIEGQGGVNYAVANSRIVPQVVKTQLQKEYNTAKQEFILAALRKETGAAISAQEMDQFEKTYFGQPGDTPDVIRQKQTARMALTEGLKPQAGRAIREYQKQGMDFPVMLKPGETLNKILQPPPQP